MKTKFVGWNLFVSYGKATAKIARKNGWVFLGYAKLNNNEEVRVYRMWKIKDKLKEQGRRRSERSFVAAEKD